MNRPYYFILILFLVVGCKARKNVVSANEHVYTELGNTVEIINKVHAAEFDFEFLSAKAKINIESGGKKNNVSFTIRMKKDEKIWISVTAIGGIEVARVLLTPDSVNILDRINNRHVVYDYEFLSEIIKNQVDFHIVQALMIGNSLPGLLNETAKITQAENEIIFNSVREDVGYTMLIGPNLKLHQLKLNDSVLKQELITDYSEFNPIDNSFFPFVINSVATSGKESVKLQIQYNKVEKVQTLEFPFSVPKNYE